MVGSLIIVLRTIEITHMSFCLVCSVMSTLTRNLLQSSVMSKIDEVVYVEHSSMKAGFSYLLFDQIASKNLIYLTICILCLHVYTEPSESSYACKCTER